MRYYLNLVLKILKIPMHKRVCQFCGSKETKKNAEGHSMWYNINDKACCIKCYLNKKRTKFNNKHIILQDYSKNDICSECGRKVGDEYINNKGEIKIIKQIQRHHDQYDKNDPSKHVRELCVPCHNYKGKPRTKKDIIKTDRKFTHCPKCSSFNIVKYGTEHQPSQMYQKYKCKDCGRYSY